MYTSIKIKKNVRKLRIDDPPSKVTDQISSVTSTNKDGVAAVPGQTDFSSKFSMQNMPALDHNLPQSLRGVASHTNIMRHSHQSFQPLGSLDSTGNRKSLYLQNLMLDHSNQQSPTGLTGKTLAGTNAVRYNDYVTSGHVQSSTQLKRTSDSQERASHAPSSQKLAVGQLRLKPSQIVQEAKNDVQFGKNRQHPSDLPREGGSSLAILSGYLQNSQSQKVFQPLQKKNSVIGGAVGIGSGGGQTESSRQQEKIAAVINERFVYKENSRFKKNRDASNSRVQQKRADDAALNSIQSKMQLESVMSMNNKDENGGRSPQQSKQKQQQQLNNNFQSINTEHAQTGNKVYNKYQKHFKSPLPSNFQVIAQHHQSLTQKQKQRSSVGQKGASLFNAHQSVQSMHSQLSPSSGGFPKHMSSAAKPHQIQTASKDTNQSATYVPFLKKTPLGGGQQLKSLHEDMNNDARRMKAYPSQKLFEPSTVSTPAKEAGKAHNTDEKARLEYMPYQVQLMSLANMSANQEEASGRASNNLSSQHHMPNQVKMKQERIIQRLERKSKKEQGMIVAPQGPGVPSLIRKSRNPSMMQSDQVLGTKQTPLHTRPGSVGKRQDREGSTDHVRHQDLSAMKEVATTLGDLPDPVDQVKLLPLKARMIFKKAMKELDSVDLVNSQQLPMSRPRIRAILRQMKDNLEQGTYEEDQTSPQNRNFQAHTPGHEKLLQGMGKQAERDLFGMLIREKKQKKINKEKNQEMRQLYEERMLRKKMQYERIRAKEEQRQKIKDDNGYLSASSSDIANSFEQEDRVDKNGNIIQTERNQKDFVTTLLSSERPSSAEQAFGSVTSRKDIERYNKMRSLSTKRKKKQEQMVLEELLALIEKPNVNTNSAAGNFYSKFQNLDKIIQQEDNEIAVNTMQEQHEQREMQEEMRMKRIIESPLQKGNSQISPTNKGIPTQAYHSNDDFRFPKSGKSSFLSTPGQPIPSKDFGKSPIIEYLKQAQKDNLLPHFMPFKKLQEATSQLANGANQGRLKYCLDQFSINTRVAPSIASAIMNLKQLQSMSLVDTMLGEESFMTILRATPKTLISLNLSQNEHLTIKCYRELHSMENLAHLSLEKCNIRDETIAVLLDLDPHKLNAPIEPVPPEVVVASKASPKKKSTLKQSFSLAIDQVAEEDETPPYIPSGLVKTLEQFNVSKNQISDAGAKDISNFIDKSECLETLQLHWNQIRAKGAMYLAKSIKANRTIKVLDISFNSFGSGAVKRAILQDDLKKEEEVQVDQRHPINKLECAVSAWKWRKTLMKNFTLMHLDISFNSFTDQDMIALSDGLRENHTLLGCHVEGNSCKLDSLGFIVPMMVTKPSAAGKHKQRGKEVYDVHNYERIPITMENVHLESNEERNKAAVRLDNQQIIKSGAGDLSPLMPPGFSRMQPRNCWLCEGWTQMLFEIRLPDKFIGCEVASVYLHLGFEDYKPMVMQEKVEEQPKPKQNNKREQDRRKFGAKANTPKNGGLAPVQEGEVKKPQAQTFQLYRMIPPSKEGIQFYYSLQNPKNFRKETFIDQHKKKIFVEDDQRELLAPTGTDSSGSDAGEIEPSSSFPKFVNQTKPIKAQTLSLTQETRMLLKAKPRCAFNTQELSRPKSPWSLPKSFFAKYKADNDLIIGKCFDWDWRCSTLEKMIKDPQEKEAIIKYLRPKYGLIRETYKHLACVAPAGNTPSLGMNILTDIMLRCNEFVDYKYTKLSDVDLAFIATNAVGAKNFPFRPEICINPERQIIRYQFFEILIRLAVERFTQKQKMSHSEGIKVFYEQFIQDTFMTYTSHPWRLERYWNEDCDTVIKENMEVLKDIYNAFAQAQSPGDPKIIRLNHLIDLITQSGVCDDNFGAREIGPLFNLAMQTNMDEINKTRHMDMQFIEFVEALARIADKAMHHNTVEFPIERSKVQGNDKNNQSATKNPKTLKGQMSMKMASVMQSVIESRENSPNRTPEPIKSSNRSRQKTGKDQNQNTSGLVLYRQTSGSPSFLREGVIEPEPINNNENMLTVDEKEPKINLASSTIITPRKAANSSMNLDLQNDLTPAQQNESEIGKGDATAHNLSIITGDHQAFGGPNKASFMSASKAQENGSMPQSTTNDPRRRTARKFIGRKATNRSIGSAVRSGASRSGRSRGFGSDYSQTSMNDVSAFEGEMHLSEKLQKYINRIAVTCLGEAYAQKHMRAWRMKNARNARNKNAADADLLAQAELLGQIGFKSTLQKLRYSNQKPPSPKDNKKGGNKNRASVKIR